MSECVWATEPMRNATHEHRKCVRERETREMLHAQVVATLEVSPIHTIHHSFIDHFDSLVFVIVILDNSQTIYLYGIYLVLLCMFAFCLIFWMLSELFTVWKNSIPHFRSA